MPTATSAQLNVRMDKSTRMEGDRVLASRGYTPAEFVRKVWWRLAQRGEDVDDMVRLVEGGQATYNARPGDARPHVDMQPAPVCHAEELWATLEQSTGLNLADVAHSGYVELSYKELLETAHAEELR